MAKDATQQVLDLRQRVDRAKTRAAEARAHQRSAEDQLTAADDAIRRLEFDPDRDLERQVNRAVADIENDVEKLESYADEVDSILAGD